MTYSPILLSIASKLEIVPETLYQEQFKFEDALSASPVAINSIDLMESIAWAFTQNNVDEDIDVPAFTLDDDINELVEFINKEIYGSKI